MQKKEDDYFLVTLMNVMAHLSETHSPYNSVIPLRVPL